VEGNWVNADPGFVDPGGNDFRLAPDSPVPPTIGFSSIPVDEIGLPGIAGEVVHAKLENPAAGRLRATIENLGRIRASGTYTLWIYPEGAATPGIDPAIPFALAPGEKLTVDLGFTFATGVRQATAGLERDGEDLHPSGIAIK
jgi:hypothetical protein